MMRRFVFLVLFLACFPVLRAHCQPGKPSSTATDGAADYPEESSVVDQLHTTYRFESDGTGRKETIARIRVQSEAGVEQWGQLVVGYSSANERVEVPYVRVRKADGTVVTATDDAIQDLSAPVEREAPVYTDFRQKHITVPGLRPGEELEYDIVTIIHTPLADGQFWTDYDFATNNIVLDEQLQIDVPQARVVKLKTQPRFDPKVNDAGGRRVYTWTHSHLVRSDEKDQHKKDKKAGAEPEPPAVQLTTFSSWQEVGRWYAGLEHERRQPTPEIRAKADQLTQGKQTALAKVEALYDYVATNFRYISLSFGVGRYQPHAAGDVLHNQYGDCKDKHTLLAALLEAEGMHASSVLINSTRKLDPDLPSPAQFDHVISLLPLDQQEVWMDTTTEVAPFRLLSFNLRGKQALVVPPEGEPHLQQTPLDPPVPNTQLQDMEAKLNELGKLDAQVKVTVRGDTELLMRMIFRRVPNAEWKHLVGTMNSLAGLDGEITDLKVADPAATHEPFHFEYRISKPNYFDWSKKKSELVLPLSQLNIASPEIEEDAEDDQPIKLGPPGEYQYRLRLELPTNFSARPPLPFSLKRDYGEYQATYKLDGNVLTAERRLQMRDNEVPAGRSGDYLAFRRALVADEAQQVQVENTSPGQPSPPPGVKAEDLAESADSAINSGNFSLAIELLTRASELDPKTKNVWNNLGRAYLGNRQNAKAIQAFQKQIEINPYDEYAYNYLGRVYWIDRDYEQAAAAFGKQIEISPLDKFAHANLGNVYRDWRKYKEAVPELEKAAQLSPDDASIQVTLGDCYLNLGQDDNALKAFDRAVEISATPVIWNDIAYQLSLKGSHLDRAEQYAESAVAATSAASRNLSLNQLTQRDLAIVPSLVAYWDTLGWVYFAQGDLDKAERFVGAAWALGQHGEVGDHLGQIYEKRGHKEDAIRAYAQAMTALRPSPDTRDRLASLLGGDEKVDPVVRLHAQELAQLRTVRLNAASPGIAAADYFLLVGNNGAVDDVKFISGDPKLKEISDAVRHANYNLRYPGDVPAKVLRRGVVSCSEGHAAKGKPAAQSGEPGGCTLVLLLPEDVHSVD
jgi:tetratricopeptide (TPR) repeat protein/transglutaminase-like putative cysteine protease